MRSPLTGASLVRDGDILRANEEMWPVVDEIAFLRADRQALARAACEAILAGRAMDARVMLLGDQDGWAKTPPPDETARLALAREPERFTFRDAMGLLAFGPVGTYFEHRWSDPTFLSGLALAEAYWTSPRRVFELACGAGHFLREFARTDAEVVGADLVFAKLWLARTYVAPEAALLCFDAASPWPMDDGSADFVFCHDAFYFLADKPHVAHEMRRVSGSRGRVVVGHAHNAAVENLSAGAPLRAHEYAALFPDASLFDDRELTAALIGARAPVPADIATLETAPAIALAAVPPSVVPRVLEGGLTVPPLGTTLRRNPLYVGQRIAWPSPRYQSEYGPLATYPDTIDAPVTAVVGAVPDALIRRRVFVDLPARW